MAVRQRVAPCERLPPLDFGEVIFEPIIRLETRVTATAGQMEQRCAPRPIPCLQRRSA
jgi:hypothetical protein